MRSDETPHRVLLKIGSITTELKIIFRRETVQLIQLFKACKWFYKEIRVSNDGDQCDQFGLLLKVDLGKFSCNFLGSSENWYCYYLGHFRKNWSIFIPPSDHTDADGGIHKRGGIIVSSQFWQVEYTKLIFLPTQSKQLSHLKRSGLVSSYILLMFELITCIYSTFCVHMPVIYSMNSTIYVHILVIYVCMLLYVYIYLFSIVYCMQPLKPTS